MHSPAPHSLRRAMRLDCCNNRHAILARSIKGYVNPGSTSNWKQHQTSFRRRFRRPDSKRKINGIVGQTGRRSPGSARHSQDGRRIPAWYNWLSTNVDSALNQGRPVILFGRLPDAYKDGRTIDHAVVAYGKSKDGHNIVHYTYNGRQSVILNSGLVGSNTHFLLR